MTPTPEPACPQDDAQFVREATLALLGRRPLSEVETQTAASFIARVDALEGMTGEGRRAWARALMDGPEFIARWQELVLDSLQVPRTDVQALVECYDALGTSADGPELARHVRDHGAREPYPTGFTFLDLLRSSLVLDDLSPLYRAHLFAMLTKPNVCGNVDEIAQELSARQEVGHLFDAAYTNRDQVCLGCHNSESSVTYRSDPAQNRHFAIAANLERAVFGKSSGVPEATPHAVFRTLRFAVPEFVDPMDAEAKCDDGSTPACNQQDQLLCADGEQPKCPSGEVELCEDGYPTGCSSEMLPSEGPRTPGEGEITPWGADPGCGVFSVAVEDDPASIDAQLASVQGRRATVFDLEQAYRRGVESLAASGLRVSAEREVADSDEALAYLLALNIVDRVWREVIGSSLTISTRFPRTQATHDMLESLTNHFVAARFSLKTLLLDLIETAHFNAKAPDEACGSAYGMPPVFDVWVRDEPDPAQRNNSPADGVHPLSARSLLSATNAALGWPAPPNSRFPGALGYGDYGMFGDDPRGMRGRRESMRSRESDGFDASCSELESCAEAAEMCAKQNKCCQEAPLLCEPEPIPEDPEFAFQRGIGVFMSISQKGFRGFDLGARLVWEERFGACQKPEGVTRDAVDEILARARERNAAMRDVVLALKDRLIAEPLLEEGEAELIEALLDRPLAQPADIALEPGLRRLCGALLSSPQHLLGGLPARGGEPPLLGPSSADACRALAALPFANHAVRCDPELIVEQRAAKAQR